MRQLQEQIIEDLKVIPTIDPQVEVRRRIDFLKDYLKQTKMATLVLGISGGQDSALAGRLAQLAVEELRKESGSEDYQFIAVRLPYGEQADEIRRHGRRSTISSSTRTVWLRLTLSRPLTRW